MFLLINLLLKIYTYFILNYIVGFDPVTKYLKDSLDEIRSMIAMRPWDIEVSESIILTTVPFEKDSDDSFIEEPVLSDNIREIKKSKEKFQDQGNDPKKKNAKETTEKVSYHNYNTSDNEEDDLPYITPSIISIDMENSIINFQSKTSLDSNMALSLQQTRYRGYYYIYIFILLYLPRTNILIYLYFCR